MLDGMSPPFGADHIVVLATEKEPGQLYNTNGSYY